MRRRSMSSEIIRIEKQHRKSGGPRIILVCKCKISDCHTEVKIRKNDKLHTGLCATHAHQKRPFESIYQCFRNDWRKLHNTITYDDFLKFTEIKNCVYCTELIPWIPYSVEKGKYKSRAYFLDRKDNNVGYTKENCVVCCTKCNKLKNNILTHEEMLVAMKVVVEYRNKT